MESGAPPEGGLAPAIDEELQPDSGGSGTCLNTINTTPGNMTHGTSHYAGGAASCTSLGVSIQGAHQVTATTADYPSLWWSNRSTCSSLAHNSTEAIKETVDALMSSHPPSVAACRSSRSAGLCSSCACDDDARSFPRFYLTDVASTCGRRLCGELIRAECLYTLAGDEPGG
eukprot:1562481-Prymnesium_polylepis.1